MWSFVFSSSETGVPIDILQPAVACFPFRLWKNWIGKKMKVQKSSYMFDNQDFECVGLLGVDSKCPQHLLGVDRVGLMEVWVISHQVM